MSETGFEARKKKTRELIQRRADLLINNVEWARLTESAVNYQTIRRMEAGESVPRESTLRKLESALDGYVRSNGGGT